MLKAVQYVCIYGQSIEICSSSAHWRRWGKNLKLMILGINEVNLVEPVEAYHTNARHLWIDTWSGSRSSRWLAVSFSKLVYFLKRSTFRMKKHTNEITNFVLLSFFCDPEGRLSLLRLDALLITHFLNAGCRKGFLHKSCSVGIHSFIHSFQLFLHRSNLQSLE